MSNEIIDIDHSEKLIDNNSSNQKPIFTGEKIADKEMLYEMGFEFKAINTIYNNMHPNDLQEALDYLNKNDRGKYTHSFLINERYVCAICGEGRYAHQSEALFVESTNTPNPNINSRNNTNNAINSVSVSDRWRRYESSYRNSLNKNNNYNSYKYKKECGICGEEIDSQESYKISIKCKHIFCKVWFPSSI